MGRQKTAARAIACDWGTFTKMDSTKGFQTLFVISTITQSLSLNARPAQWSRSAVVSAPQDTKNSIYTPHDGYCRLKWSLYASVERLYKRMFDHDPARLAEKIRLINVGSTGES